MGEREGGRGWNTEGSSVSIIVHRTTVCRVRLAVLCLHVCVFVCVYICVYICL